MNRQLQLEKSLQEEELKLNKMVVETEGNNFYNI